MTAGATTAEALEDAKTASDETRARDAPARPVTILERIMLWLLE
jgi:hypothetical protein